MLQATEIILRQTICHLKVKRKCKAPPEWANQQFSVGTRVPGVFHLSALQSAVLFLPQCVPIGPRMSAGTTYPHITPSFLCLPFRLRNAFSEALSSQVSSHISLTKNNTHTPKSTMTKGKGIAKMSLNKGVTR